MLDDFFGSLGGGPGFVRGISDRGFAKARDHLSVPGLQKLNTHAINLADSMGLVPRWRGLRVVAGDASVLHAALRSYTPKAAAAGKPQKLAAAPSQRLFSLYLPGSELTLFAQLHSDKTGERQMLVEALSHLLPGDVLVLDRGYPATWLVALLNEMKIKFCMRCDSSRSGWTHQRRLLGSDKSELVVRLSKPTKRDVKDFGLSGQAPELRLVRHVTSEGKLWMLATNLPAKEFPAEVFGELYHKRWRIEECYKRLKHVQKIESASGLTQQALEVDIQAKVLADNLTSLVCAGAVQQTGDQSEAANARLCNRTYAARCIRHVLTRLVLGVGCVATLLEQAFALLKATAVKRRPGRNAQRPNNRTKPHPKLAYKG